MFWTGDRLLAGRDVFFFEWGQKFVVFIALTASYNQIVFVFYGIGSQILDLSKPIS